MEEQVTSLFRDILLFCDEQDLIGKDMFAFDGCKPPSNASKEWPYRGNAEFKFIFGRTKKEMV